MAKSKRTDTTQELTDDVKRQALLEALKTTEHNGERIPIHDPKNFSFRLENLESEIERLVEEEYVKAIKKITYHISTSGLSFDEACLVARKNPTLMRELMNEIPAFAELVRIKYIEYKSGLMHNISEKARQGDTKLSTWLLEKKFSDEFGTRDNRYKNDDKDEKDPVKTVIAFIQQNSEQAMPVNSHENSANPGIREVAYEQSTHNDTAHDSLV